MIESVSYDSFANGSSTLSRYGYTGREWDADSNFYYYRNGWYDPQAGRFISADPIGLEGGINPYAYVANNPHSFTDPSGLSPFSDLWNSGILPQRQPMYPDRYDWYGAFWKDFGNRCKGILGEWKAIYYDPLADPIKFLLAQPDVQFALMSMGMPFGTPWAGLGAGPAYMGAGRSGAATEATGAGAAESGWTLPSKGGANLGGRWYSEHALERMAPRTPEVMAELEKRALGRAEAVGLKTGTPEFKAWWGKNGPNPRGIPPSVVEAEIANSGSTGVRVILGDNGSVVTVIPD